MLHSQKQALVVDSEPLVLVDLEATLRDFGYDCEGFARAADVPDRLFGTGAVSLAVVDWRRTSRPLADKLHRLGASVILTSTGEAPAPEGMQILRKPFLREHLAGLVAAAVARG